MNTLKILIFFFLFLFSNGVLSQSSYNEPKSKFSFGFSYSPEFTNFRNVIEHKEGVQYSYDDPFEGRYGFTTGISVGYDLNSRFKIQSGLYLSDKGDKWEFSKEELISPDDLINGTIKDDPAVPDWFKSTNHLYYLGIPLKLNYYFIKKKLQVFVGGGLKADFYVDNKEKHKYEWSDRKETSVFSSEGDFNSLCWVGIVNLGFEYPISKQFYFIIEPVFRYSFTRVSKGGGILYDIEKHPYSIGANFSICFQK